MTTAQGTIYTPESPKLLSRGDMDYLSYLVQEMEDTVLNRGVHPDNGKTLQYLEGRAQWANYAIDEIGVTSSIAMPIS